MQFNPAKFFAELCSALTGNYASKYTLEGVHPVRENFCEQSGGKCIPSPRGRAREGVKPVGQNSVSVSEQNLLFPYYPISLFPFKKGGVPC